LSAPPDPLAALGDWAPRKGGERREGKGNGGRGEGEEKGRERRGPTCKGGVRRR